MGKKKGEVVEVAAPRGSLKFKILEIAVQPPRKIFLGEPAYSTRHADLVELGAHALVADRVEEWQKEPWLRRRPDRLVRAKDPLQERRARSLRGQDEDRPDRSGEAVTEREHTTGVIRLARDARREAVPRPRRDRRRPGGGGGGRAGRGGRGDPPAGRAGDGRGGTWGSSSSSISSTAPGGSSCSCSRTGSARVDVDLGDVIGVTGKPARKSRVASRASPSTGWSCWPRRGGRCRTPSTASPTSRPGTGSATSTC